MAEPSPRAQSTHVKNVASAFALLVGATAFGQQVILPNVSGGDRIVGPALPTPLVNGPGWFYQNVRIGGEIGVNADFPHLGNGSVSMKTSSSAGKADIEFFNLSGATLTAMGRLADISEVGYDWYRAGSSTNAALQAPAMRLYVDADSDFSTTNDRGYLIYEPYYTRGTGSGWAAETDQWVTENATGGNFWQRRFSPGTTIEQFDVSLAEWSAGTTPSGALNLSNASVYGLSLGVGSGWAGTFTGAVDNVRIGFSGQTRTVNFEAVPEPASMAVLGLGLAALKRRRAAKK